MTINLVTKNGSQIALNITSYEWVSANKLALFTNNPLNLSQQSMQFTRRLLAASSLPSDYKTNIGISQNAMDSILPNYPNSGEMSLDY